MKFLKQNDIVKADWVMFGLVAFLLFVSLLHNDIVATTTHGLNFLEAAFSGQLFQFYSFVESGASAFDYTMPAFYYITTYLLFAIWQLPLYLAGLAAGGHFPIMVYVYWSKVLCVIFFLLIGYMIYRIAREVKLSQTEAKTASWTFLTSFVALFSPLAFSQYDVVGVFFFVSALYYYIKKDYLKFSLLAALSMTFKAYTLFALVPLLLFAVKNIVALIKYLAIACSGIILCTLLFIRDAKFLEVMAFNDKWADTVVKSSFEVAIGNTSRFLTLFVMICFACYLLSAKGEGMYNKCACIIPMVSLSALWSLVRFHSNWVMVLIPFLVLTAFQSKNKLYYLVVELFYSIAFIAICSIEWRDWDGSLLLNKGILPVLFGYQISSDTVITLGAVFGKVPLAMFTYNAIFVGASLAFMALAVIDILNEYKKCEIAGWAGGISEKPLLYIRFLLPAVALYYIPCLISYFSYYFR